MRKTITLNQKQADLLYNSLLKDYREGYSRKYGHLLNTFDNTCEVLKSIFPEEENTDSPKSSFQFGDPVRVLEENQVDYPGWTGIVVEVKEHGGVIVEFPNEDTWTYMWYELEPI